jgi:hypothetical protein
MPYKIDFVGLVHFLDKGNEGKLVLMPDGRHPDPPLKVSPHYGSFFIQNEDIIDKSDWWPPNNDPVLDRIQVTELRIAKPSRMTISGMEDGGNRGCWPFGSKLDAKGHKNLPRLENDRQLQIVPEWAETIAQMAIRQGTLESFLFGGKIHGSGVSRLTVAGQSGPIVILAHLDDGSGFKTLKVNDGTEIVLSNTSNLLVPHTDTDSHFRLYGKLDMYRRDETLKVKPPVPVLDPLPFNHRYLKHVLDELGTVPNGDCSNSCC